MTPLAANLKRLMDARGLNANSLAQASDAKQSTVFRILEGVHASPRDSTLVPLARFFGISVEELRYGSVPSSNVAALHQMGKTKLLPLISYVQAGSFTEAMDVHLKGYAEDWIESPSSAGAHAFWLRVVGDSMTSAHGLSIPEGMLILVDPDREVTNGCLVVAKIDNQVTFKKIVFDAGRKYLKPINPAYPVIECTEGMHIVGVVKEAKHCF